MTATVDFDWVSYTVHFVGDHFALQTTVELDMNEPDTKDKSDEELAETAEELATNLLKEHYGWEMKDLATIECWAERAS